MRFAQPLLVLLVAIAILGMFPAGCARRSNVNPIFTADALQQGQQQSGSGGDIGTRYPGESSSMDSLGIQWPRAPYDPVYFAYDSYALSQDTMTTLSGYAPQMQSDGSRVLIEGHCDERGTAEYNLTLGEHRAQAVKAHLVRLGVEPGILTTISYGEELPADPGHDEQAWSRNRRVEFGRN